MEYVILPGGIRMPQLGYGTLQIADADCERCIGLALKHAALPAKSGTGHHRPVPAPSPIRGLLRRMAGDGKTVAQVVLRWNLQRGVVVIPKAVQKEQMEENFKVWDFELAPEDMTKIGTLDLGYSEIINFTSACTAKNLNEWKIHD